MFLDVIKNFTKEYKPFIIVGIVALLAVVLFTVVGLRNENGQRDEEIIQEEFVAGETDVPEYEPVSQHERKLTKEYDNKVVTCTCRNGETVSLGVDLEDGDYLYLNPSYSAADTEDGKVLFFFWVDRTELEYDVLTGTMASREEHATSANFASIGRTNDKGIPAAYLDEDNYGVRWKNNVFSDGKEKGDATTHLYMHVIRIADAKLIDSLQATIEYDPATEKYGISSFNRNDVLTTGSMEEGEREAVVESAASVLQDDSSPPIISGLSDERIAEMKADAVVEMVPGPLFRYFYDLFGEVVRRDQFPNIDFYAVNLYVRPHGTVTFYFVESNLTANVSEETDGRRVFTFVGYDGYDSQTEARFYQTNPYLP